MLVRGLTRVRVVAHRDRKNWFQKMLVRGLTSVWLTATVGTGFKRDTTRWLTATAGTGIKDVSPKTNTGRKKAQKKGRPRRADPVCQKMLCER